MGPAGRQFAADARRTVRRADTLEALVCELLEDAGIDRPPVDPALIARQLGLRVQFDDEQPGRGRLVRAHGQALICVRPQPRPERHHWTVAHEIGEHLFDRIAVRLNLDSDELTQPNREQLVNRFAMHLLVPSHWFAFDCPLAEYDLLSLKALYDTASHEVIALRFLDLDPPTVLTIFDNGRLTRRSGNLPYCLPAFQPLERSCRLEVEQTGRSVRRRDHGLVVQAWPIHEPLWQRQILRCVIETCE
jgi:hypothetical protein